MGNPRVGVEPALGLALSQPQGYSYWVTNEWELIGNWVYTYWVTNEWELIGNWFCTYWVTNEWDLIGNWPSILPIKVERYKSIVPINWLPNSSTDVLHKSTAECQSSVKTTKDVLAGYHGNQQDATFPLICSHFQQSSQTAVHNRGAVRYGAPSTCIYMAAEK